MNTWNDSGSGYTGKNGNDDRGRQTIASRWTRTS